ncbi:beta-ketoacyl synthase N-terminal-like domain-containing protein [Virgisporangium aurantiacum]|uniref:Type I polyketide synthase n=1 Tax=Virgisporangium aurantiacum TaxID=175570 RepID=A0A8J4E3S1_9ACTN|nr:beta-ketoacyl synthase N-terminal-like domain-containing protein [Virgisporangium aurantiacum]GIJ60339.1 type I polyketide synthase [Virgisporangium aurantiacum]
MEEPIAVVGRGCAVPGALDPDTFWANVAAGRCELVPGAGYGRVRGFDDGFDPSGFQVGPDELMGLDPLFRWVLHAGRQALREAGYDTAPKPRGGLVLGNLSYPTTGLARLAERVWRGEEPADGRDRFGSGLPAHLAAHALGLGRGGFALDAACASALYAVGIACDRLRDHAADLMLAGAVSRSDRTLIAGGFRALGASSPTGRSRPFHRGADGLVPGEGVVLFALTRLSDAVASGLPVLGVIRAVGLANDGRTGGLLVPAEDGQERAMRLAYARAGVAPESVTLVECHATGTPVGDAVEARSVGRVFGGCDDLPIGSVKSNIGHLLTAAGGAGLLKVLGAMRAGVRPASLAADDPIGALSGTPLRLLRDAEPWPAPRRAGVSAFGFGGANAHVVVDGWDPDAWTPEPVSAPVPDEPVVITAIGAKVADGADVTDLRRAVLTGDDRRGPRAGIDVALAGLRFPPRDLAAAHAQHVLLLEAAREASAGRSLPRERTAVIVGMGVDPEVARYATTAPADAPAPTAADVLGTMPNLVANRVNVQLDVAGPSFTVSAEEASGLTALDLATRALRRGEVDVALVGAVDLSCEPVHLAALRAQGRDRYPGDAAVVLVLERRADARRAGRPEIAVLDAADGDADLVVGAGDGAFDPATLFGTAHAAHGLVAVAAGAVAVSHRAVPRAGALARPTFADLACRVTVDTLGAAEARVTLRSGGPAQPWVAGPVGRLRVYSGADRAEVVAALTAGRESAGGPARLAMVVDDDASTTVVAAHRWLTEGGPQPDGVAYRDRPLDDTVAFVFTGGSASYPGMGRELALAFPHLAGRAATSVDAADGAGVLARIWGAAVLAALHVDLTRDVLGLRPDAAVGYSSGESAALCALGAWRDPARLLHDLRASDLFSTGLTGEFRVLRRAWSERGLPATDWASYLVGAPAAQVRAALQGAASVHLMMVNAPRSCVVGGAEVECARVLARLGNAPVVRLDYPIAAHVPELTAVADEYRRLHLRPTRDVPGVRFYSGATGEPYRATAERAADAILAQATGTVDFVRVVERAYADGVRVFVEHGPQSRCTTWIRQILAGRDHLAVALDAPDGRAIGQLCHAVAELTAAGLPVRAEAVLDHLAAASGRPAGAPTATVRLAAHPAERRLPRADEPVAMPRAPTLPPVPVSPRPVAARPVSPVAPPLVTRPGNGAARVVAEQFARVSAVHRDFLAHQALSHARFVEAGQRSLTALLAASRHAATPVDRPARGGPPFDRADLERLAAGHLADLFGPRFAALDGRRRLTRLPTPPMLLVDRVTAIDAEQLSMGTGTIRTETDVTADAWYLDSAGRMPAGLMVEAGQADLLLISWLGVDLQHGGDRTYRLLGCELTYHASPAAAGETLRYEIHVDGHAEHDGVRLFFFHYDCYVGDQVRMTVRDGQAGFFTDAELADTAGLQWDPGVDPPTGPPPDPPVAGVHRRRFDRDAVRALADGRPADCFGPQWTVTKAHVRSPRIDTGRMLLLDTVPHLDPGGGPWGRGYLRAETPVASDDWYFDGHFTNDPCMPGTLMFQGGVQAMSFYLAALGYTIERDGWRFEPVPDEPTVLRCRGQVAPGSRRVTYEVFVRELRAGPYPTLYADVLGTVDGVKAFHAQRAGVRLVPDWPLAQRKDTPSNTEDGGIVVGGVVQDHSALLACARGPMARAMGEAYRRFDVAGRRAPRLPGPPYHVMTRIVAVDGEFGGMGTGAAVTAEYDVPGDAWYLTENGAATMPVAVLMEVALQPCGWLAMYLGSVLDSDEALLFRNLDGTGTLRREVLPGTRTLRTRVENREISRYGGMIIESFSVTCTAVGGPADGETVFDLETVFGFFPPAAFVDQPGLPPTAADRARLTQPGVGVDLSGRPARYFGGTARLPGPRLVMLDRVTGYVADGGTHGLGWLRADKDVDADDWYFKAHFFQDPVQPGSLGVQAMCSLLQWYLLERNADAGLARPRFEPVRTGHPVTWKYRGQVVPTDTRLTVELDVTAFGTDERGRYATADGWLWVDGRRIYHVAGLGMRVVAGP